MLPPLASTEDFEARFPEPLPGSDVARAEAALVDASTLVRTEAGKTWTTEGELDANVPDVIVMLTLTVARRAFLNPDSYKQETLGDHSVTFGYDAVYLTDDEKALIASTSTTGQTGLWTLATTRSDDDVPDIYLDVVADDPIPFVPQGSAW